jgi:hypothetical protein
MAGCGSEPCTWGPSGTHRARRARGCSRSAHPSRRPSPHPRPSAADDHHDKRTWTAEHDDPQQRIASVGPEQRDQELRLGHHAQGPLDAQPIDVDRHRQVDDRPSGADQGAELGLAREHPRERNTAQVNVEAQSAALSTPSLASCSSIPLNASVAISHDTVKPTPAIAAATRTAAPPVSVRRKSRSGAWRFRVQAIPLETGPAHTAESVIVRTPLVL